MALVTIHRSPTTSNHTTEALSCDLVDGGCEVDSSVPSPHRSQSCSEYYLAVKGAALILTQSECMRTVSHDQTRGDIGCHLQSMFYLLRSQDTIKVAVELESRNSPPGHHRYLALVSTTGTQDLEESVVLGIDVLDQKAAVGLVLPVWSDLCIRLDGDGGYSLTSNERQHFFKPISVQVMWSSLQCLNKVRDIASLNGYLPDGLTHTWIQFYQSRICSNPNFIADWFAMDDIESHREHPESCATGNLELEKTIRAKLREMALTVDFEEVTSKQLRTTLEEEMNQSLTEFRHFIDEEIVVIFRQMEAPSRIFDYLYLGTEWNASNLDELRTNGVGYILNVAREIDNFFPGSFKYLNIRVHDTDDADLLKHWDKTYKFISQARSNHSKVLVHCKMGVSRSASTVVAFAMKEMNWTHEETLKFVQRQRSCVKPNKGFKRQLETYQGILDASKHRHNKLWKSSLSGLQTSTPIRETDVNSSEVTNDPSVSIDPLSFVSPTQHSQDKTQAIASSNESAIKRDSQDALNTDCPAISSDDSTDEATPSLELCTDWNSNSQSESDNDDLSSLYPDAFLNSRNQDSAKGNITLLRYEKVDRDLNFSEMVQPSTDVDESDSEEEDEEEETSSNGDNVHVSGYYDLSMLAGYRVNSQCEDDDDDDAFLNAEESPLLHPDMVLEWIQAENRKKRQTLQLLRQTHLNSIDLPPGKSVFDSTAKRTSHGSCASENSEGGGVGPSLAAKVRPDNYWIRETTEDGGVLSATTDSVVHELTTVALIQTEADVSNVLPSNETESSLSLVMCSSVPVVLPEDTSVKLDSEINQMLESENPLVSEVSIPERVVASGSVNLSGQDAEDVSEISPKSEFRNKSEVDSECLAFGDARTDECSISMEIHRQIKNSDASLQRPLSIYETEDILLEPGIVLKTKREIELREKSSSSIELSFGKESKSVQRSSSWRLDRSRSRDRNSERRRTCLPVFLPSPASADSLVKPAVLHGAKSSECGLRGGTDSGTDIVGENLTVCRFSLEDVEVEKGIVKKTTKEFEEGLPVPVIRTTVELSSDVAFSQASVSINNEFPVDVGLVRRQTRNIETRFGSISPQLMANHVLTDLEAREQGESGGSERVATDSAVQGEIVTPIGSNISLVAPSGDFLPARRDERRLHLSLSQKPSSLTSQSFGSPNRPRKELLSTPLDLTQKELSTRKACSPMRETSRGFELHCAEANKVPCLSENVFPRQEVSVDSSSLQRNLSQGNVASKTENSRDWVEKDCGGFSRTFSLRETSSMKLDETEKSKFSRSHSLRGGRPHYTTTSRTGISSQLARKQPLLATVADDHLVIRSSQASFPSPSSMIFSMAKTFDTGELAQSDIAGKQRRIDSKGTTSLPSSTAIDSSSNRDFKTTAVCSEEPSNITAENIKKRTEFQSALVYNSISPLMPEKGLQKNSEPLPLGMVSTINCGALESCNVSELQNSVHADVSDKARSSDPMHCVTFSTNSCTCDKGRVVKSAKPRCSTPAAMSVDSTQSRCSDDTLSSVAVTVFDISSVALPQKVPPDDVIKFPSLEHESNSPVKYARDVRADCERSEEESMATGAKLMKSFLKMKVSDQFRSKAKVIQIQSTTKAEEERKIGSGKPCKIAESNASALLPAVHDVSSASSHSFQKATTASSAFNSDIANDSMQLTSTLSDSCKLSQSKVFPSTEKISIPKTKPSDVSSTSSSKSATAESALVSNSSLLVSNLTACDTPVCVLGNKRPNDDGNRLDGSNTDRSAPIITEQPASKYDGECIEASKLSSVSAVSPRVRDASGHDRGSSKCYSKVSSNAESVKAVTQVTTASSDKHGPRVDDAMLIDKSSTAFCQQRKPAHGAARNDFECTEKKNESLSDSKRIALVPQSTTVDQLRLSSVDSVNNQQQNFVKYSGESNKADSAKCQKESGKTSLHCLSYETKCNDEVPPVKVSCVVMRPKNTLKTQASSDAHPHWSEILVPGPARSISLHEHSARKLYGKSHPLAKLPTDKVRQSLPLSNSSISRRGLSSSPVIDTTSGSDRLLN